MSFLTRPPQYAADAEVLRLRGGAGENRPADPADELALHRPVLDVLDDRQLGGEQVPAGEAGGRAGGGQLNVHVEPILGRHPDGNRAANQDDGRVLGAEVTLGVLDPRLAHQVEKLLAIDGGFGVGAGAVESDDQADPLDIDRVSGADVGDVADRLFGLQRRRVFPLLQRVLQAGSGPREQEHRQDGRGGPDRSCPMISVESSHRAGLLAFATPRELRRWSQTRQSRRLMELSRLAGSHPCAPGKPPQAGPGHDQSTPFGMPQPRSLTRRRSNFKTSPKNGQAGFCHALGDKLERLWDTFREFRSDNRS